MSRCALVTGGARGIGLGISRALAREGVNLAILGRKQDDEVQAAVTELRGFGVQVIYCQADIAQSADRQRALAEVRATLGPLNVLVNNAGVAPKVRADLLEATEESFEWVLRTNLQGPYFLTQAVAREMIRARQQEPAFAACIINVSSISATVASPSRGEYCISKAGVSMATQLWAVRLGEYDIPVYEVRPGVIMTDMTSVVKEKYDRLIGQGLCLQARWGQPEDVGKAVAMLVRGDLPYATGQVLMVDGGLTVPRL
jgi:NAD(P)-dependent dehydrogenase (short-subunit alcohol dehydrogenase family)